jgi:NAD(P)-dependent dehydrogenase (short-subunit alcohol dehydrogenase family)
VTATYVITGGSDGIGLECASRIARERPDSRIALVGRSPDRTATAVGRIRRESPEVSVDSFLCDFGDLAAVRRLADDLLAACARIDVLVNNAGTVFARRTLTVDGIEATFQVNHLAGLLLTELLLDRIRESAPARIVFTASDGHYSATMDLDDLGFQRGYSIMRAYSRSKLANVLTARLLARRLKGTGVTVTSLHPGAIATNIWSGAPWFARPVLAVVKRWKMESPAVGGERLAYLATSPEVEGRTGGYYRRNRLRDPSALALDDDLGRRLYEVSADLVGLARPAT